MLFHHFLVALRFFKRNTTYRTVMYSDSTELYHDYNIKSKSRQIYVRFYILKFIMLHINIRKLYDVNYSGAPKGRRVCYLRKVVGPCKARIPRYYYSKKAGCCVKFYYGGCRGNGNNFKTRTACERRCKGKRCEWFHRIHRL